MRKAVLYIHLILLTVVMTSYEVHAVEQKNVKMLDIESNTVIYEKESSVIFDREVIKAIKSIKNITVQANPLPQKGYLIKVPLTASVKVKNKWFDDFISEALFVYNLEDNRQHRLILYNDENTPVFFDIDFDFAKLTQELNVNIVD